MSFARLSVLILLAVTLTACSTQPRQQLVRSSSYTLPVEPNGPDTPQKFDKDGNPNFGLKKKTKTKKKVATLQPKPTPTPKPATPTPTPQPQVELNPTPTPTPTPKPATPSPTPKATPTPTPRSPLVFAPVTPFTDMKEKTGDADALPVAPPTKPVVAAAPPSQRVQKLLTTLRGYVGMKEQPKGSNRGPMIDKFNASAGLNPNSRAPWCASVAHYVYTENGLQGYGAYSPSWFNKRKRVPQTDVQPADVGLIYFPSKGRYAHTIAAIEETVRSAGRIVQVTTLEGNTNAQGSREGDQFARRRRPADTVVFMRHWK
jgi:hypothetical protein